MAKPTINPGTIAAMAAAMMAQAECMTENAEVFSTNWKHQRELRIRQFVGLAISIAFETEAQINQMDPGCTNPQGRVNHATLHPMGG